MKSITINFSSENENDAANEAMLFLEAPTMRSVLLALRAHIRSRLKYGELTKEAQDELLDVQKILHDDLIVDIIERY